MSLVAAKKKYGTTNRVEMVERAVNGKFDDKTKRWVLRQSNALLSKTPRRIWQRKSPSKQRARSSSPGIYEGATALG